MRHLRFNSPRHRARRALFGLGVIGIGGLALLDNLHLFEMPLLRTLWPLVLVMFGVGRLIWPRHASSWLFGTVLIAVGSLMTLHNLGQMSLSFHDWWPVFVILAGVSILLRGLFPRRRHDRCGAFESSTIEHGETVNIDASFSGVQVQNDSRHFKGGKIDATFGGVELDLRQAAIEGEEAVIDLSATFSGVALKVPREWQIVVSVSTTLGAVEDKTVPPMNPTQRLVLRGEALFGGVEIKH